MAYLSFTRKNIRRTPIQAIAATMVMFLTFFSLLTFLIVATGFQSILKYYESKPQVIAFFNDNATNQDITTIQNALQKDSRVVGTKYVSKEEALNIYRDRNKNDPMLLELVTANILPASLEISTTSPENLSSIAQTLRKEPVVEDVIVPEDVVQTLTSATQFIRIIGSTVVSFLILFSTLVILMVIGFKIRIKRDEIEIMRLIGASSSFIRIPFIMEGIFYGIVGALLAWLAVYALVWYFTPYLQSYLEDIKFLPIDPLFMLALLGFSLIAAFFIGIIGSVGAVRRYLRV